MGTGTGMRNFILKFWELVWEWKTIPIFREQAYILKVKKLAESIHEPKKIGVNGNDKNSRQEYVNHEIYD